MPLATHTLGTITTSIGKELYVGTFSPSNVYVFKANTSTLGAGDAVLFTVLDKVLNSQGWMKAYEALYAHTQGEPVKISVPLPAPYGMQVTVLQHSGIARPIDWHVITL